MRTGTGGTPGAIIRQPLKRADEPRPRLSVGRQPVISRRSKMTVPFCGGTTPEDAVEKSLAGAMETDNAVIRPGSTLNSAPRNAEP
jgi:hypothetical protein